MDYPRFEDALARFRSFLNDQGHCGPIGWVFPSDVLSIGGGWIIRPRPQEKALAEVATAYKAAVARRLGVRFNVLCLEGDAIWCYIVCPTDQSDAERCMMPDGLKLSVPTTPRQGRTIADEDEWESLTAQDMVEHKRWMFT